MSADGIKVRAKLMWANLDRPNEISGKYQVDLCNLSEAAVAQLKELNIECNFKVDKAEKGNFLTCKSTKEIVAYDPEGHKINDRIGNGTEAIVKIKPYSWEWKNKKGVSGQIASMTITKLVALDGAGPDLSTDDLVL